MNQMTSRTKYTFPKIPPEDEKFIIRSPYSDVEVPEVNLADYVWKDVDKWPENVALVSFLIKLFYSDVFRQKNDIILRLVFLNFTIMQFKNCRSVV